MLVLSRLKDEKVIIYTTTNNIINIIATVTIVDVRANKVRLGFEAPTDVTIHREEVFNKILNDN